MRKIYSLVLLATALLIGTNTWASIHSVQDEDDEAKVQINGGEWQYATYLKEAFDAVQPGQTAEIVLLNPVTLNDHITMPATINSTVLAGTCQNITLNLNGKNITVGNNVTAFRIMKGTLNITGTGTISKSGVSGGVWNGNAVITIAGAESPSAANWSNLTIGENVVLSITPGVKKGTGIIIQDMGSLDGVGNTDPLYVADEASAKKTKFGYCTYYNNPYVWRDNNLTYTQEQATVAMNEACGQEGSPMACGALFYSNNDITGFMQGSAYGVNVTIEGTVKAGKRALQINGYVNQKPSCTESRTQRDPEHYPNPPYYQYNYPYVKIGPNAHISADPDGGCTGIYASGYGVFDIAGEVYGATGVYMKAGDVNLQDAYIHSTYTDSVTYSGGGASGVGNAGGSAIAIESNDAYAGNSGLSITGDTKVEGGSGYAIHEQTYTDDNGSTTSHVTIEGGTIEGGTQGAIAITNGAVPVTTIGGGNINESTVTVTDGESSTDVNISNLFPNDDDYHATAIEADGKTVIVVSQGETPIEAPGTDPTDWDYIKGYSDTASTLPNMKWEAIEQATIASGVTVKLGELQIISGSENNLQQLTIRDGATLQVNHLIMNDYARIIVNAGGKLIVEGTQGIVAPSVENIVLESDFQTKKYATFLFNPAVSSNKHPNATVEFGSYSFYESSSNYQSQRFGVPTWEAVTSIKNDVPGLRTRIQYWGANGWENLGEFIQGTSEFANINRLNKPFDCYIFMSYQNNPGAKYTMTGKLVGNVNNVISTGFRFTPFANSYTADLDIVEMLNNMTFADAEHDRWIYIAAPNGNNGYSWQAVDEYTLSIYGAQGYATNGKIAPLQPFIMHITGDWAEDHELNYEKMVWDPVMDPTHAVANGAPRRAASVSDNTAKLRVVVSNEQGELDDVKMIESTSITKRAEKYMNDDVNIYAHTDVNSSVVMNDNLEDTYFGFSTVNGGEFTISFDNVEGREFDLIDLETGVKVAVMEGETYSFVAAANTVADYRFKLVERAKMPTAIENTEAVKTVKGVYTITGQYLGEMNVWNTLPAGVYVVNGAKCVK